MGFKYFGNDSDGFTIVDFLTVAMFAFFVLIKISHIIIVLKYSRNAEVISQMNLILKDVSYFTKVIILFYFSKKTIDGLCGIKTKPKRSTAPEVIMEHVNRFDGVELGSFDEEMFNKNV